MLRTELDYVLSLAGLAVRIDSGNLIIDKKAEVEAKEQTISAKLMGA